MAAALPTSKIRTTVSARDADEGVMVRDEFGNLIRQDDPSVNDYGKMVMLKIDGQEVEVPLAVPLNDANGTPILDVNGNTTPRFTTIYDAAMKLYGEKMGRANDHIPVLCHQPHMTPVAVCRMCTVQIWGEKRGEFKPERKLLPACQYPVKRNMEVYTMMADAQVAEGKHVEDGDLVRTTTKTLTELLASNHLKPAALTPELSEYNELGILTRQTSADASRFSHRFFADPAPGLKKPGTGELPALLAKTSAPANGHAIKSPEDIPHNGPYGFDSSSPVFQVDHSACVMCDRCVRACGEVKHNNIIGRTGKGAKAAIGFDLDDPMGDSNCVQCGECMVSCPTTAISFKPVRQVQVAAEKRKTSEIITAKELLADPIFRDIPPKFLFWQQGLVMRRRFRAGDVLARQGEPGNTAFLLKGGKLQVRTFAAAGSGGFNRLVRTPLRQFDITPDRLMVGEMACLSGQSRSGDIVALEPGEVWELRRNVLDRLMRLPAQRARIDRMYQDRAMELLPGSSGLFKDLPADEYEKILAYLRDNRITFARVSPGRTILEQGAVASNFFMLRMGYVQVRIARNGNEAYRILSRGPGSTLGEIGLLGLTPNDVGATEEETDRKLQTLLASAGDDLTQALPPGRNTATVTALDYVEMARMSRGDFLRMVQLFPAIRRRLVAQTLSRLREDVNPNGLVEEYTAQGLYEARSVLVLDLDRCTRCDECTRGCVKRHGTESHGVPMARMMRDGMRFGQFLVATSCRSCETPHCMSGCPVDAIHRGKHMQIVIEDHCIGCGLCASNCPYGSITVQPNFAVPRGEAPRPKAVNCDLCDSHDERSSPNPSCVASCPHDAAFRFAGPDLLQRVLAAAKE